MNPRMVNIDRQTPMLLPPDLREWVPGNDLVHLVIECVESMRLATLTSNRRGSGSEQYPPRMMLALLIYCYANGLFSSRRIERATYRDVAVRYLAGNTHPDHDTICKFRRENFDAIGEAFLEVLQLARQMGVLKVGTVSVDGTHLKANASKACSVRFDRAVELEQQLQAEIADLMTKAQRTDEEESDDGQSLPEAIASRQALQESLRQAREELEARAKVRAETERAEYERKLAARRPQSEQGRKPKGKPPKPPKEGRAHPGAEDRINLTDPDSRAMRKSHQESYQQAYNAQAVVDADGSMLMLATHVITTPAEFGQLETAVQKVDGSLGTVQAVVADAGYAKSESIQHLHARGVDVYVAVTREDLQAHPHDLQRPVGGTPGKPQRVLSDPTIVAMHQKLQTPAGREQYAKRKRSVEPVFGIIKGVLGFRQFLLRGLAKVRGEWSLVALAYNVKRLWRLRWAS